MEKRHLNKSEIEISPVVFGAWAIGGWMWGGADRKASIRALQSLLDHGISSIDTAPIYGFGLSETLVGEAIRGKRDHYEILTKSGMRWDRKDGDFYFTTKDNEGKVREVYKYSGKESLIRECEESLKRLQTDYIDLYQIHWPDRTTPIEEAMEAFQILKEEGKIRAAGVSNYSLDQVKRAASVIELSSNQVPYSMVNRGIERELVPWCLEYDCGILAYSPLQRGLLTGKITPGYRFEPGDNRPDTPYFNKDNLIRINAFLDEIKPMANDMGATLSQLVIAWTLGQPGITAALVGARTEKQVKENAGGALLEPGADLIRSISEKLEALELDL